MITLDNYDDFSELITLHGKYIVLGMKGNTIELTKPDSRPPRNSSLHFEFLYGGAVFTTPIIDPDSNTYKYMYLN
jgi:hypothetical protein